MVVIREVIYHPYSPLFSNQYDIRELRIIGHSHTFQYTKKNYYLFSEDTEMLFLANNFDVFT